MLDKNQRRGVEKKPAGLYSLRNDSHEVEIIIVNPPKPPGMQANNPRETHPGYKTKDHAKLQKPDFSPSWREAKRPTKEWVSLKMLY